MRREINSQTGEITEHPDVVVVLPIPTQADLIAHAEQLAAAKEAALKSPLDSLRRTKASLLQGKRGKGKPLTADETGYLDALEADPRVLASVTLLDAAESIIADIDSGAITTLAEVDQAFGGL